MVTPVDEPDVLDGLGLPDTRGGDRRLAAVALQDGERFLVDLEGDDALGADQTGPERRAFGPAAFLGIEIKRDAAHGLITRMDFVPDDEPDAFVAKADVRLGRLTAFHEDGRFAGDGRTSEEGREVEPVSAQDPEVEPASPMVLLAAYAHFLELADLAGGDQLLHHVQDGMVAVPMGDGEPHALLGAEPHDLVGLGQRADERFLDIDALHARFDRGDDHVAVLMDMPRADRRDIRLGLRQHGPVVGVGLHPAEPLRRLGQTLGVGVRDGDDPGLRNLQPDGIFAMTIVALTGVPDDPDSQRKLRRLGRQGGERQDHSDKEDATFHGVLLCCRLSII